MSQNLKQIIDNLNKSQRQAVEAVYGPVLVLAGPGTGKTHMLTTRIAHILQSGIGAEAHNILCLTFTENAAVEMRTRLQKWIGPLAYQVKILTFHGFCQWVIDDNSQLFYEQIGHREIADDLQKALIYREAIKSRKWKYFSSIWDDFVHQYDFLKAVSDLKRENINPEKLRELIPEEKKRLEAHPDNFYKRKFKNFNPGDWKPQARVKIDDKLARMYELADLWEVYEGLMQRRGFYDFDDLIAWVVEALSTNESLRLDLQERFQWIMVDEYQDTNDSQNAILWELVEGVDLPNIFAVGDADQSIYRFQGASVANVQDFRQKFGERKEITLTENYRSHQNILDAAYHSIDHNLERANKEMRLSAQKKDFATSDPGTISQAELASRASEISFLAETIKSHLAAGVLPKEIAILVRKNREIEELAEELPKFGVPVSAQVSQNIFENEYVRYLILMLMCFVDAEDSERLFDLLHAKFLDIDPEVLLLVSLSRERERSIIETLLQRDFTDKKLQNFLNFFIQARRDFHHSRAAIIAEKLLYESGLAKFLTDKNKLDDWQSVKKFIAWIREQAQSEKFQQSFRFEKELPEILNRIQLHQNLGIKIFPDPLPQDTHSIRIMTAHKSKGLEFEVVLIPGLEDKKWGNPRGKVGIALPQLSSEEYDENEEERRLFFVALTRAKSQLYLSYSVTDFSGRDKTPSMFWHEIPEEISTKTEAEELEIKLQHLLPVFFEQAEKTLTNGEKAILQERVKNFRWSVSSLQSYLDCPRKFLYQNLYKFPRRPMPQAALGTALHQALEKSFLQIQNKKRVLLESVLENFDYALRGQNIPQEDFENFLSHGQEILQIYYEQELTNFETTHPFGYELEYDFSRFNPMIDNIRITGKMDKIVFLDEKRSRVKIVDYKSGRPRSIVSGESYWRQLVFYDLLTGSSRGNDWIVESCEIEFLTPDSNGKLGKRSWEVSQEDREKVISELKWVHEKVMNLEFPLKNRADSDERLWEEIQYWQSFGQ